MFLHIRPCDYLFFRDSKPFDAGVDSYGKSLFPPAPSVLYGALRTAIMVHNQVNLIDFLSGSKNQLEEVIGTTEKLGTLKLQGPWLAELSYNKLTEYFPPPLFLMKDNRNNFFTIKLPQSPIGFITNLNFNLTLPLIESNDLFHVSSLISSYEAVNILSGKIGRIEDKKLDLFKGVYKVGIKRDTSKRTTEEGKLYSILQYSLNPDPKTNIGLVCTLSHGHLLPDALSLKIGGESRVAHAVKVERSAFQEILEESLSQIVDKIQETGRFFIWLITPAIFKNGFLPDFVNPQTLEGEFPLSLSSGSSETIKVKLKTSIIKPSQSIGGFDLARRFPRPMYKAVPAGSVYYFDILESSSQLRSKLEKLVRTMNLNTIYSDFTDFQKQGFGTILVGGV